MGAEENSRAEFEESGTLRVKRRVRTWLMSELVMRSLRYPAQSVRYVRIEAGLRLLGHCQVLQGVQANSSGEQAESQGLQHSLMLVDAIQFMHCILNV